MHLIYDEKAEIEFISKYEGYDSTNCFLSLDAKLKNIEGYYANLYNLADDEQPFAETLKQAEIEKVIEKYTKKKGKKKSKVLIHEGHLEEAYANKTYTFAQDFEKDGVNSIKGVACIDKGIY